MFAEMPDNKLNEQEKINILENFLKEDPGFMERAYNASGGIYAQNIEMWKEIGMTDEQILERFMAYPIRNLRLILDFEKINSVSTEFSRQQVHFDKIYIQYMKQ